LPERLRSPLQSAATFAAVLDLEAATGVQMEDDRRQALGEEAVESRFASR
jgi:hypothetical protein